MATQLYQLANVQTAFAARIRTKVQDQREAAQAQVRDIPLLGWLLGPLAGLDFDQREAWNTGSGAYGEHQVLHTLLRWLPNNWFVFHNVVVEPQPDRFAQIDLLLVSPAGVFLIETKAWRGSYKSYRDVWHQRAGNDWVTVASPTGQVQRQARILASWLEQQRSFALPASLKGAITPLVAFTQPQWLHVVQSSVAVFADAAELLQFLQVQPSTTFNADQVATICDLIIRSPTPVGLPADPAPATRRAPQPADAIHAHAKAAAPTAAPASSASAPFCPNCGITMVLRTARQGANAGNQFYGCRNFPRCRSIIPLERLVRS
jgi:hypothetical protein